MLSLGFSGKGADEPLSIYGPPPLEDVLRGLLVVAPHLPYPLHVVMLSGGETFVLTGVEGIQVSCTRVEHDSRRRPPFPACHSALKLAGLSLLEFSRWTDVCSSRL